jgi:hypothetical protein
VSARYRAYHRCEPPDSAWAPDMNVMAETIVPAGSQIEVPVISVVVGANAADEQKRRSNVW